MNTILNSRIGKTEFMYGNECYRLTGFYFTYYSNAGVPLLRILCTPNDANTVSGYGICGWVVASINDISILEKTTPTGSFENEHDIFLHRVEKYQEELNLAKKLKPNMSESKFNEIMTKRLYRSIGLYNR